MDLVKILEKSIKLSRDIYTIINKVNNFRYEYSELGNDMLIVMELFFEIKNSRLILLQNDNINETINTISENLNELYSDLEKSLQDNIKKKIYKVLMNDVSNKKEKLSVLITRLKLLLEISREKKTNSRMDIMNILKKPELILFWDKHFGSENNNIPFELFIQSLEDEFKQKFKKEEAELIRKVIDMDSNRNVSIYEFNLWIKRFGPLEKVIYNTFVGLYDAEKEKMYEWYFGDAFKEKVENFLYDKGYGTIVIRNNFLKINSDDNCIFCLDFVGWSLRKDESTILEIPIIYENELLRLDISKIKRISIVFEEATYFINLFLGELKEKKLIFSNLEELYMEFNFYLRSFGNNFGLIYYSHFENKSYRSFIYGEIINFLNKYNFKLKKLTKNYDDFGDKKKDRYGCCIK